MFEVLEAVLRDAPGLALSMIGAAALAVLFGGASSVGSWRGSRTRTSRQQRVLSIASAAALVALPVALFLLVQGARTDMLAVIDGSASPGERISRATAEMYVQLGGLLLGSLSIAVATPIAIAGAVLPLRRPAISMVATGVSLGVAAGALASAAWASEIMVALQALANAGYGDREDLMQAMLERAEAHLDLGRVGVVVSAALTGLAAWAWAAREGVRTPARGWIGAASLFVAGAIAFAATRDLAYDARHPLPPRDGFPFVPSPPGLPELTRCEEYMELPGATLVVHRGIARLDGRPTASPEALVAEGREWPYRGRGELHVVCDGATPTAVLTPWLRAAHRGGYQRVLLIGQRVSRLETRTLRTLVERRMCSAALTLDVEGEPLGRYATCAALARAAEQAVGDLRGMP